jgi:hypothetical protein
MSSYQARFEIDSTLHFAPEGHEFDGRGIGDQNSG